MVRKASREPLLTLPTPCGIWVPCKGGESSFRNENWQEKVQVKLEALDHLYKRFPQ